MSACEKEKFLNTMLTLQCMLMQTDMEMQKRKIEKNANVSVQLKRDVYKKTTMFREVNCSSSAISWSERAKEEKERHVHISI